MDTILSVLQAALGIGFLIFIHEAGHYLAARLAGVRVEVFSLGFGPRLAGFRSGSTDYRLSLVPVGGYVRVRGEDPTQRDHLPPDSLYAKSHAARALFFSGGVIMNVLFALIAFPLVFRAGVSFTAPVLGEIDPGGAAWSAGLESGDRVVSIDGKAMYSFENLVVETALLGGRDPVEVVIERGDARHVATIEPRYSADRGLFGIGANPAFEDVPLEITEVAAGSPAALAGLRPGDRIVAIDGEPQTGIAAHRVLLRAAERPGQPLALTVARGDERVELSFLPEARTDLPPRIGVLPAARRIAALRDTPPVRALGLEVGDVVLRVDGQPFGRPDDDTFAGDGELRVTVVRSDRERELVAALDASARTRLLDSVAFGGVDGEVRVAPTEGSPAARAGIEPGARVLRVDGRPVATWEDLVTAVTAAADRAVTLEIATAAGSRPVQVRPEPPPAAELGFVRSLRQQRDVYRVESVGGALAAGFTASVDLIKQMYVTLKRIATGDVSARNLGGIVTISKVTYDAAQGGWPYFFWFLALLSINLAFVNVLPIPVLDGGHLLFLLIEKVKGSPVSAEVVNYSQILGLVFVIALMIFVTYNDILRLL